MLTVYLQIASLIVLLCMSAFASASEVALFSLTPNQMQSVQQGDSRSSRAIMRLRGNQEYTLATILILNNLVNICIVILTSYIIDALFTFPSAGWSFGVKTVAVTFILLLFGEIIPKIFAQHNSLRMARFAAVPLVGLSAIFRPLSFLLASIGKEINRVKHREAISMDDLSDALEVASQQNSEEQAMLSEIVEFATTEVRQIMRHRPDITALNIECDFDEVRQTIMQSGFSRIPVYSESIDHIEGVLYIKDLITHIGKESRFEWQKHLRPAYFVPEYKKINDLLEEFRANRVHLAIVVDEYGSTQGLVSMEDVLEEVVGEIVDESDVEHSFYTVLGNGRYLFDGKTHISDLIEVLNLEDNAFDNIKGNAETVAGLMLEAKGDFLQLNESLTLNGITFTVRTLDRMRINRIEVENKHINN